MSVSARASFFFDFFWSDNVSVDLVIGEDSIFSDEVESTGSSISSISVALNKSSCFPGIFLKRDDLIVSGITIAGENVIITDYVFEPFELSEGVNTVEVRYRNLCSSLKINVIPAKLIKMSAEYIGKEKRVDEEFVKSDFKVTGLFEDGTSKDIADFEIEPIVFSESGSYDITVSYEDFTEIVTVEILPKEYLFGFASEMHIPTGSYVPNVIVGTWNKDVDYAVDGKTYGDGIKLTIGNWMSGLMGNGNDFREKVTSNMYINVNQDMLANLEPDKKYFDGWFVVHRDTNGSTTTANISIYADDVLVYQSGDINAASIKIPPFKISVDGVEQIRVETVAQSSGNDFIIGCIVKQLCN